MDAARHDADVRVATHPEPLEGLLKRQVLLGLVMVCLRGVAVPEEPHPRPARRSRASLVELEYIDRVMLTLL